MSTPDAPAKSKKSWLVPVLAALLAGGGGAGFMYMQRPAPAQAAEDAPAEEAPIEYGAFYEMDGVVINPRGTQGRRFFMVKVGVEAKDEKVIGAFESRSPAAKDALLDFFGALSVEQLGAVSKRDSIKEALRGRLNTILGEDGELTRIYFTQYVLQ
jgi:flagellar basal body-associated protein FliL